MIKLIRVAIQFAFFALTGLIFFRFIQDYQLISIFNSLHIVTSLSALPWLILPAFFSITVVVIILPAILGRLYCSYVCPVGFIQDLVFKITKKLKVKKRIFKWHWVISLLILGITLGLIMIKSPLYGVFDHYTNIGRLFGILKITDILSLSIVGFFTFLILLVPVIFPRFFCNTLCPTGALYTILGRSSYFSMKISDGCNGCGLCSKDCPTLAIQNNQIVKIHCISCLECINSCPQKAISFGRINKKEKRVEAETKAKVKPSRRDFFIKSGLFIFGGFTSKLFKSKKALGANIVKKVVVPPGAKSIYNFAGRCTSCYLCVSVCPTKVIIPQLKLDGVGELAKPQMDFDNSYCSYECNSCLAVCPTNALSYCSLKQKKQIKIGHSVVDTNECIPYKFGRECLACAEHCPTGAVKLKKFKNTNAPVIDEHYCIGCGACQYICPTTPKSIIVVPEPIHLIAYGPLMGKENSRPTDESDEDFPF